MILADDKDEIFLVMVLREKFWYPYDRQIFEERRVSTPADPLVAQEDKKYEKRTVSGR